jgi:AcrR family transcriptional regulator
MPRARRTTPAAPARRAGGARSEQAAATRERILAAAIELIAERGYAATSIEALCQRAGVVRTAIYWHFGAKEGLLVPVIEHVAADWIEEIRRSVYRQGEPIARLDRLVASLRDLVIQRPHLVRLLVAMALERSEHDPGTRDALRAIFERARAAIVQGVEDSLGGPWQDSQVIARTALAFLGHAAAHGLLDPRPGQVERVFEDLRVALLLMVGARLREREGGKT